MSNRAFKRSTVGGHPASAPPPPPRKPKPKARPSAAHPRFSHYIKRPLAKLTPVIFGAVVCAGLAYDWVNRNEGHITPENGVGYWLGIVGGMMMLVLMLYPLRKRIRGFKALGKIPSWFRWHMVLGIIGPAFVMVHSNWKLQSLNATVATISMLIVVFSGVIGRYLYSKVHMGLYGRKSELMQIMEDATALKKALGEDVAQTGQLLEELRAFEKSALAQRSNVVSQLWASLTLSFQKARARSHMMRVAKDTIAKEGAVRGWSWNQKRKRREMVREHLRLYFATLSKAASFSLYERLFALWHVLHMPLFFLLIIASIIHVLAVHLY